MFIAECEVLAAEVTTSVTQTGTACYINISMLNNDPGAIYKSAELRLESIIGTVMDSILRHKAGYTTRSQVLGSISTHIWSPPTGEVHFGWEHIMNTSTGGLVLANLQALYGNAFEPDVDYDVWRYSQYTGPYPILNDQMAVTLNLGGMLDFDGDSQLDAAERLLSLPPLTAAPDEASAGFVGIEGLTRYPAAVNRFAVAGAWVERARAAAAHGVQRSGSAATLSWQALHGLSYTLQTSLTLTANPADWTPLSTQQRPNTPGPELAPMTFIHSGAFTDARRFYRLLIEVAP